MRFARQEIEDAMQWAREHAEHNRKVQFQPDQDEGVVIHCRINARYAELLANLALLALANMENA